MALLDDVRAEVNEHVKNGYAAAHILGTRLERIEDVLSYEDSLEFTNYSVNGAVDATGNGPLTIGPTPMGTGWMVTRIAVDGLAAFGVNPICNIYLDEVNPANLVDVFQPAIGFPSAHGPGNGIYVAPGRSLVFNFLGLGADEIATAAIQVKQFEPTPTMLARLT